MAGTIDDVFNAIKKKEYEEVISLIKTNQDLVNAVHPETTFSLLQTVLLLSNSQRLAEFIVTHAVFNPNYKNENEYTNIGKIITSQRLDLLTLMINDPRILINDTQLTYEFAKTHWVFAKSALDQDIQKDPNSKSSERSKKRVEILEEMMSLLRDATILHAIATNNADLLTQLDKAGGNPTQKLGTLGKGQLPGQLVKSTDTNIREWFKAQLDNALSSLTKNPNSFYNKAKEAEQLQEKINGLEARHLESKSKIYQNAVESKMERLETVKSTLG